MEVYPSVRVGLDKDFKDRNDRVPPAIPNYANKDDLVKMDENMAQEAIAGNCNFFLVLYLFSFTMAKIWIEASYWKFKTRLSHFFAIFSP